MSSLLRSHPPWMAALARSSHDRANCAIWAHHCAHRDAVTASGFQASGCLDASPTGPGRLVRSGGGCVQDPWPQCSTPRAVRWVRGLALSWANRLSRQQRVAVSTAARGRCSSVQGRRVSSVTTAFVMGRRHRPNVATVVAADRVVTRNCSRYPATRPTLCRHCFRRARSVGGGGRWSAHPGGVDCTPSTSASTRAVIWSALSCNEATQRCSSPPALDRRLQRSRNA